MNGDDKKMGNIFRCFFSDRITLQSTERIEFEEFSVNLHINYFRISNGIFVGVTVHEINVNGCVRVSTNIQSAPSDVRRTQRVGDGMGTFINVK